MADPISASITAVVAYVTSASAAVAAGTATLAQLATTLAVNAAVSTGLAVASNALMGPKVGRGGSPTAFKADPTAPIRGVMGYCGVGGTQAHMRSWGKENVFLSFVTVLSLGPIGGVDAFTANGALVTFPGSQGKATSGPYVDKMWMTYKTGAPSESALMPPSGQPQGSPAMDEWTSAHKMTGHAASFWTMRTDSKRAGYPNGVPMPQWMLWGMTTWDPRYDSTYPGGSGPQRRDDWRTWEVNENPYLHALAWARGHFKLNTDGTIDRSKRLAGIGAPDRGIDIAAFCEGANVCDANEWRIAGEWTTADDKWSILAAMLQAGGGEPLNRGAQISCLVNTPRASILTLTRADLAGPPSLKVMKARRDRFNTVIPRYRSPDHKWEMVAGGAVSADTYVEQDRGEPRSREIEYSYVPRAKQAAELAAYDLVNAREGLEGAMPFKPYVLGLRAGDAFTVDEPEIGLDAQKFVIRRRTFDPATVVVDLEVRSETDAKHDFALGRTGSPPPTPGLTVTDPTEVAPPDETDWVVIVRPPAPGGGQVPGFDLTGVVSNETATSVLVEWWQVPEADLEAEPDEETVWTQAYSGPPTATNIPVTGVDPGATYFIAVSYVRGPNTSARTLYGPYLAPDMVAAPVDLAPLIARIDEAEDVVAANEARVDALYDDFGDIVDAAESAAAAASSAADAAAAEAAAIIAQAAAADSATASQASRVASETARTAAAGYASAASTSATTASTAATAAGTAATASQTARLASEAASTTSGTHASAASISANAASASATAAGASASTANTQRIAAEAARTGSETAASASAASATSAAASATAAGTSASASDTARIAAQTAQTGAESARTTAVTASETATTAAATATTQAGLAAGSATTAGGSAAAAAGSASSASTSATNAGNSASAASGSEVRAASSSANAVFIDAFAVYRFVSTADGWTSPGTLTTAADGVTLTQSVSDTTLNRTVSFPGSRFTRVIVDIERTANRSSGVWEGILWYSTSGHGASTAYRKIVSTDPALGVRQELTFDMAALTAGGTDWLDNTITGLRFDFDSAASGAFKIRSIRIVGADATAPAVSASAAAVSASAASTSATAAGTSATAASGSATSANTAAGNASTFAGQSSSSATAAAGSATTAASAASTAGTAATTATSAAGTATTQASNAGTSASEAYASSVVAASMGTGGGFVIDPVFQVWPVGQTLPTNVTVNDGAPTATRETSADHVYVGSFAFRAGATAASASHAATMRRIPENVTKVVIDYQVRLNSGDFRRAGLLIANRQSNVLRTAEVSLFTQHPSPTTGRTYAGQVLVNFPTSAQTGADASIAYLLLNSSGSAGGSNSAKNITWQKVQVRPATPEEIAANTVIPTLQAAVTSHALAITDLEGQNELARFEVAAVTGGGAAILRLASDNYGSVAGLLADEIYFGPNTFFDDATDQLRTTFGTDRRVIALGASFGGSDALTEWKGLASVAYGSETKANAKFYQSDVAPFIGGSALPTGSGGAGFKTASGSVGVTSGSLAVDFASVLSGGLCEVKLTGTATGLTTGATGTYTVYEQTSSGTGTSGTAVLTGTWDRAGDGSVYFGEDQTFFVGTGGARRFRVVLSAPSEGGTIVPMALTVVYTPPAA